MMNKVEGEKKKLVSGLIDRWIINGKFLKFFFVNI